MAQTYDSKQLQQLMILLWRIDDIADTLPPAQRIALDRLWEKIVHVLDVDGRTRAAAHKKYKAGKDVMPLPRSIQEQRECQARQATAPLSEPEVQLDPEVWDLSFLDEEEE